MSFEDIEVKVNKPYPEIVGATDDQHIVAILKNLANGRLGEIMASSLYIYQSVVADETNEEIGGIFEEIGVVEMMHLDMLMHAITDFGGVPQYQDANGNFFNTASLNYSQRLIDMLENDIRAETMAIDNYLVATDNVKNESLKRLFERIIEDEKRHLEIFNRIKSSVKFMSC